MQMATLVPGKHEREMARLCQATMCVEAGSGEGREYRTVQDMHAGAGQRLTPAPMMVLTRLIKDDGTVAVTRDASIFSPS